MCLRSSRTDLTLGPNREPSRVPFKRRPLSFRSPGRPSLSEGFSPLPGGGWS